MESVGLHDLSAFLGITQRPRSLGRDERARTSALDQDAILEQGLGVPDTFERESPIRDEELMKSSRT